MKKVKISLGITLLILSTYVFGNTTQFIAAKIIDNDNQTEEAFTSRGGMEGWAKVSFIIDEDGNTRDIVVFDNSGKDRYTTKTIRYIKNLKYAPARANDNPVSSAKNMFITHTYSEAGHSEASITPAFAREYQLIMDSFANSSANMNDVNQLIDKLVDDHTKNLNEHALAAWLKSIYYYKIQDFLEYMRQSQITVDLYQYLPIAILAKSSVNLFESQLYYGYFSEAKQTLSRMGNTDGLNLSEQTQAEFLGLLKDKMASESDKVIKGKLTHLGAWSYDHQIPKFQIKLTNGNIDSVELRCNRFQQKYTSNRQNTMEIPSQANGCILLIQGDVGTTFDVIETAI
ncbi:energy transducer TonB [Paraglaciecola sp.]|uniref:energy transducer TonB n=1 Tax=Paraglaciecola sp. TaxID=1920173 RepID=UPI0032672429